MTHVRTHTHTNTHTHTQTHTHIHKQRQVNRHRYYAGMHAHWKLEKEQREKGRQRGEGKRGQRQRRRLKTGDRQTDRQTDREIDDNRREKRQRQREKSAMKAPHKSSLKLYNFPLFHRRLAGDQSRPNPILADKLLPAISPPNLAPQRSSPYSGLWVLAAITAQSTSITPADVRTWVALVCFVSLTPSRQQGREAFESFVSHSSWHQ